jgi:hypothetical protein
MNYAQWLERLDDFVRRTARLPGEWWMRIDVAPPLHRSTSFAERMPWGLRQFHTTAAEYATCNYNWHPNAECSATFAEFMPHRYSIYGGIEVGAASNYAELEQQFNGLVELLEDEKTIDDPHGYNRAAAQTLRQSAPLWQLGTGDMIVECPPGSCGEATILFVAMELASMSESPLIKLSRSFDDFLLAWEQVGYLAPELYLLQPFLEDSPDGLLDGNSPLARRWNRYLVEMLQSS